MRCRAARSNDRDSCHVHHRGGEHVAPVAAMPAAFDARITALHGKYQQPVLPRRRSLAAIRDWR
jgi:hypothetical protein